METPFPLLRCLRRHCGRHCAPISGQYAGDFQTSNATFNADFGVRLDVSEVRRGDASVRRRLTNVVQHEHVLSDRDVALGRQLQRAQPPLDERHRRPDGDARQVDRAARHHLDVLWRNREVRRNTTNCTQTHRNMLTATARKVTAVRQKCRLYHTEVPRAI